MTTVLVILALIGFWGWWWQARQGRYVSEAQRHVRQFRRQTGTRYDHWADEERYQDYFDVSEVDPEFQEHMHSCLEALAFYVDQGRIPWGEADRAMTNMRFVSAVVSGTVSREERQRFRERFIDDLFARMRDLVETPTGELESPLGSLNWMIPLGEKALHWRVDGHKISFKIARGILREAQRRVAESEFQAGAASEQTP